MKNIVLSKVAFVILVSPLLTISMMRQANTQHWPVPTTTGHYNLLNCSYSELHTRLRFHGGIDIDHDNSNPSIETILQGKVVQEVPAGTNSYVVVAHESVPGSGDYDLQSLYMHIALNNNFDLTIPNNPNNHVATGTQVGISNQRGHLHFGMWREINGQWYALNPLKNTRDWSIAERRNGQQLLGYFGNAPLDQYDPQVNQVFLKGIEQPNQVDVASGYQIVSPQNPLATGGLTNFYNLQNQAVAARIHFHNRRDTDSNHPNQVSDHLTTYDPVQDRIAVFGNIVPTVHVRDQGVNSAAFGVVNEGLTVQRLTYTIDDAMKYDITLDEFERDGDGPAMIGDDEQIFHRKYNEWTDQQDNVVLPDGTVDQNAEYKYGNNDYIRLYNGGTAILNNCVDSNCPVGYLPPHKLIDTPNGPRRSNGVWFTKARAGTPQVFDQTPVLTARVNDEALYPDREHTLTFHVEDAAGRIDRAENKAEDNAKVTVIVDNFKPFVQQVELRSGDRSTQSI